MSYGFVNTEDLEQGQGGGTKPTAYVGLNQGVFLTGFAFNDKAGKGGTDGEAVDVAITFPERERPFTNRYFPITKAYDKDNNEVTDPEAEDFKIAVAQVNGTLIDIACAIAGRDTVETALKSNAPKSFKEFAQLLERVIKSVPNWDKKPVDVFLQYQYNIQGDNERTFLELPSAKSIKHGRWIIPAVNAEFFLNKEDKKVSYITSEGTPHPFSRSEWFKNSNFFKPQVLAKEEGDTYGSEGETKSEGW